MKRRSALAAGGLLTLLVAVPVLASHVEPELVDGAESCGPLAPGTVELLVALPQDTGTVSEGDFTVDVTLDGSVAQGSISFSDASLPVAAAFVAGIDGGNLYTYEEPVTEDDGLVAPDGEPISNVSFCYVGVEDGGAGSTPDATGSPTGDAAGEGGTDDDDITTPATDAAPATSGSGPAVALMVLGALSIGAAVWLRLASRALPARRR